MRYLLIDLSYYVFHRYFAVVNFIKLMTKTSPKLENIMENKQFINKFDEMFEKCLLKLVREHYDVKDLVHSNDLQIIFVKDCTRATIWRLDHFKGYKASRDMIKKKDNFDGMIFDYVYNTILPRVLKKYYCVHKFYTDRAEADDCIAVLVDCIQEREANAKIIVITNDNDYLQLMDKVDNIFNLQGKSLRLKLVNGCSKRSLLTKILTGDPSDNIKGVVSKTKTANILNKCVNINEIDEHLKQLTPQQKENYDFNTRMINFDYIPDAIRNTIVDSYHRHTFINSDLCFCKSFTEKYEKNWTLPP